MEKSCNVHSREYGSQNHRQKTRVGTSMVNSWKGLQMVSEKRCSSTQPGPAWTFHGPTKGSFQPFSTWYSPDTTGCRGYPGAIHITKKKFEFSGVKTGELGCSQKPQRTSKQEAKIRPASDIGTPTDRTRSCPCPRSALQWERVVGGTPSYGPR